MLTRFHDPFFFASVSFFLFFSVVNVFMVSSLLHSERLFSNMYIPHPYTLYRWWNPSPVRALDVTNPAAVEWFVSRLRGLQEQYGLDGFKVRGGRG
jgi:hypothetical protein